MSTIAPSQLTADDLGKRVRLNAKMRTVEGALTRIDLRCALVQVGPNSHRPSQTFTELEIGGVTLTAYEGDTIEVLS